jgi:thioredoxin-dependent peroxiredoxin
MEDDKMGERKAIITGGGNPLTLTGNEVKVGDVAPDFTVIDNDMLEAKLSDYKGKVVVLASVPSLDTTVCSIETARFNSEAGKLGDGVRILTISMDLPFAQKRWCAAEGIENVQTLSDYRDGDYGQKYGVIIAENKLLARAIYIVDKEGKIAYEQIVTEVSHEPDYDAVIEAAKSLL